MSSQNRDLLVLTKRLTMKPGELRHEVEQLLILLRRVESMDVFSVANEIIDLNRYQIIRKPYKVLRVLRQQQVKPFVFISNKN